MIIPWHRVSATAPILHFNFNNRIHLQPGRGPSHCRPIYVRVTTTLPDFTLQPVLPESPEFIFQLTLGFEFYLRTLGTPNHMFSSTRYPIFQFTISIHQSDFELY